MIVASESRTRGPVVTLAEREALRRYLSDTDLPRRSISDSVMGWLEWFDGLLLIEDLESDALDGTVDLRLPEDTLRRTFTRLKEDLLEIDIDPEQGLIVMGACERVLGVVGIEGEA